MKTFVVYLFSAFALFLCQTAWAEEERGDMTVQAFGSLDEDTMTVYGGFGMMVMEQLKANVGLMYMCFDECDSSTQVVTLEGQYYLGDYYTADNFLFSVGGGLLIANMDIEGSDSSSETGYHVFGQANQFFDEFEDASVYYRLEHQKIGDLDGTTALRFGLEIYF